LSAPHPSLKFVIEVLILEVLGKCIKDQNHNPKPDAKTISFIGQIRDMYRNPLIHPEDNLDEDRAIILFDVCKSAIVAMVSEMNEKLSTPE